MGFDHEKLEVYGVAREVNRRVNVLARRWRGRRDLVDQLLRNAASIPLNIAEGAGEFARKEKARFYRMARRSADECAATLDTLVDAGIAAPTDIVDLKHLLNRTLAMLIPLIKRMESTR